MESYLKPVCRLLFTPHASYEYSGKCAEYGYSVIDWNNVHRIIILSTNHYLDRNVTLPSKGIKVNGFLFL